LYQTALYNFRVLYRVLWGRT